MSQQDSTDNTVKDPEQWRTGDEPITGAQESYIITLAQQASVEVDTSAMTKAEASKKIEELQELTGRTGGQDNEGQDANVPQVNSGEQTNEVPNHLQDLVPDES